MSDKTATFWREDGVINYVVPPSTVLNTFYALATNHASLACLFVDELAAHVTKEMAEDNMEGSGDISVTLRDKVITKHALDIESRMKKGGDGVFDGMYYGTMHPSELGEVSSCLVLAKELSKIAMPGDERQAAAFAAVDGWIEAAKKLVRPAEVLMVADALGGTA